MIVIKSSNQSQAPKLVSLHISSFFSFSPHMRASKCATIQLYNYLATVLIEPTTTPVEPPFALRKTVLKLGKSTPPHLCRNIKNRNKPANEIRFLR